MTNRVHACELVSALFCRIAQVSWVNCVPDMYLSSAASPPPVLCQGNTMDPQRGSTSRPLYFHLPDHYTLVCTDTALLGEGNCAEQKLLAAWT